MIFKIFFELFLSKFKTQFFYFQMSQPKENENSTPPENEKPPDTSIQIVDVKEPDPIFNAIGDHLDHFVKNQIASFDEADCLIQLSKFNKNNSKKEDRKNQVNIPKFVTALKDLGEPLNMELRIKEKSLVDKLAKLRDKRVSSKLNKIQTKEKGSMLVFIKDVDAGDAHKQREREKVRKARAKEEYMKEPLSKGRNPHHGKNPELMEYAFSKHHGKLANKL